MKNFKYTVVFILLVSTLFTGFAFTPHRLEPVDTRAEGLGGAYFTDSESFYTLFSNPAGLAFAGEKTLLPPLISLGVGGPLEELLDFGIGFITGDISLDDDDLITALTPLIEGLDNGLNLDIRVGGPLTFGAIRNNFGWGFVNTISVDAKVPGLSNSEVQAGFDLDLVFGYAVPLDLGPLGKLSIGFSVRGIAQAEMAFKGILTEFVDIDKGLNTEMLEAIPLHATFGLGLDMGVQYEVLNFLNVAVVWQDLYSPTWTKTFKGYETAIKWEGSSFNYNADDGIKSKLGVGVGVDIPLEKITLNIISHFGIYLNYNDLLPLLDKNSTSFMNPILGLSSGAELVLFNILALRIGITEMYPSAGVGLYMGNFRIDASIYGSELGAEPGDSPLLNVGLSMGIHY